MPKTVRDLLHRSKIQATLDLCTLGDSDETQAAQGSFLTAMGMGRELALSMWAGFWVVAFKAVIL